MACRSSSGACRNSIAITCGAALRVPRGSRRRWAPSASTPRTPSGFHTILGAMVTSRALCGTPTRAGGPRTGPAPLRSPHGIGADRSFTGHVGLQVRRRDVGRPQPARARRIGVPKRLRSQPDGLHRGAGSHECHGTGPAAEVGRDSTLHGIGLALRSFRPAVTTTSAARGERRPGARAARGDQSQLPGLDDQKAGVRAPPCAVLKMPRPRSWTSTISQRDRDETGRRARDGGAVFDLEAEPPGASGLRIAASDASTTTMPTAPPDGGDVAGSAGDAERLPRIPARFLLGRPDATPAELAIAAAA
jgi:hypothetical protein